MTHIPERKFVERVESFLREKFPEAEIESEPRLVQSGRIPDFRVTTGHGDVYVVEVENGGSVYEALGQALGYAAHDPKYIPAVVEPSNSIEYPEWNHVQTHAIGWAVGI